MQERSSYNLTDKQEFIGALNRILNYSRRGKHRRLWHLAIAPQPPIAGHQSAPCPEGTRIYQKPTASSEGAQLWDRDPLTLSWFRKAGQTFILNIIGDASAPLRVGCSKFRYKSDTKSARIQLVKLLIFNALYCKIVL